MIDTRPIPAPQAMGLGLPLTFLSLNYKEQTMNRKQKFFYAVGVYQCVLIANVILKSAAKTILKNLEEKNAKIQADKEPVAP